MGERIVIVGAGAVGAYVGGYFAKAGRDVTMIDPWPANVDAMNEKGLDVSGMTEAECFHTPIKAMHITNVQSLMRGGAVDMAFITMKSYDTAWATHLIKDYLAPDATVVSLQNCINEGTISEIVRPDQVVGCIAAKIAVELTGPAEVRRGVPLGGDKHTVFRVGELDGSESERIAKIRDMLSDIDSAKTTTNLWGERWSKLCANAMINGLSACTGLSSNGCARDDHARGLQVRLTGEAARVGKALGYNLEAIGKFPADKWIAALEGDNQAMQEIQDDLLAACEGRSDDNRPSMAQDIAKGRRTEIDFINGFIVDKAKEVGLEAPTNADLASAVRAVERGEAPAAPERVAGI